MSRKEKGLPPVGPPREEGEEDQPAVFDGQAEGDRTEETREEEQEGYFDEEPAAEGTSPADQEEQAKEASQEAKPKKKSGLGVMDLLMFLLGLIVAMLSTRACRP
ncbi:MAG: hypothetical protein M1299_01355 [Firmicutes bacterium]|nr:hypothetical protein [Bacillota bacterium]MCL5038472.1 hypothetical protein [Bacillota bacterium]